MWFLTPCDIVRSFQRSMRCRLKIALRLLSLALSRPIQRYYECLTGFACSSITEVCENTVRLTVLELGSIFFPASLILCITAQAYTITSYMFYIWLWLYIPRYVYWRQKLMSSEGIYYIIKGLFHSLIVPAIADYWESNSLCSLLKQYGDNLFWQILVMTTLWPPHPVRLYALALTTC